MRITVVKPVLMFLFLGGLLGAQISEQDLFQQAEQLWQQNRIESAVEGYKNLTATAPQSPLAPTAAWKTVLGLISLGKNEEAKTLLASTLSRYPQLRTPAAQFWQAYLLLEEGRLPEALAGLEALTPQADSIGPDFWYHLARARGRSGEDLRALEALEIFKKQKGPGFLDSPQPQLLLAQLYNRTGSEEKCIALESPASWPVESRQRLAWEQSLAYWTLEKKEPAVQLWKDLTSAEGPLRVSAYIRLFRYYEAEKKMTELEGVVTSSRRQLQNQPELRGELETRLGILYLQSGRANDGIPLLEGSVTVPGNAAGGLGALYLATAWESRQKIKEAYELIQKMVKDNLEPRDLLLDRSFILAAKSGLWGDVRALADRLPPVTGVQGTLRTFFKAYALDQAGAAPEALALLDATAPPEDKRLLTPWLSLRHRLEVKLGQNQKARATAAQLAEVNPGDPRSQITGITAALEAQNAQGALARLNAWDRSSPDLKSTAPEFWVQNRYLRALALLENRSYPEALGILDELLKIPNLPRGQDLKPYLYYYAGWGALKGDKPNPARGLGYFSQLLKEFPSSPLKVSTLSWAGWSAMSLERWGEAEGYYREILRSSPGKDGPLAGLYLARSLEAQNKTGPALDQYLSLGRSSPPSAVSPQALLEAANLKKTQGDRSGFRQLLQETEDRFPRSASGEEALVRLVEEAFTAKDWPAAVQGASQYRSKYPQGTAKDRVLHQSATAQLALGQKFGAALAWKELIDQIPGSPFRASALFETGQIWFQSGDYLQAKEIWNKLKQEDPGAATTFQIDRRLQEIKLLQDGASETESRLASQASLSTPEGRLALVDWGRYLILQGRKEEGKGKLDQVLKVSDPSAGALAQYWTGEYWFRSGQYKQAGEAFLKVASFRSPDRDLTASSLYRAVQMTLLVGNPAQGRQIFNALSTNFPNSDWVLKARELLEDTP